MKKILECQYCGSIITEKDVTCPKCGANCSDVIKNYRKALEEEEEAKKKLSKEEMEAMKKKSQEIQKAISIPFYLVFGAVFLIVIFTFFMIFNNIRNQSSSNRDRDTVQGTLHEEAFDTKDEAPKYNILVDQYEEYEYYDDFFHDCNMKEGYQWVAFHFVIENITDETISTSSIVNHISLKVEDEMANKKFLKADDHFCEVRRGKNDYTELPSTNLLAGDKISGYVGFEVPKNKEKMKFILDDDYVIEMDNPVYEKSE